MSIIWKSKHGTYNVLVSNKQDQTTDTCFYMGESQNYYVMGKMSDIVHISHKWMWKCQEKVTLGKEENKPMEAGMATDLHVWNHKSDTNNS